MSIYVWPVFETAIGAGLGDTLIYGYPDGMSSDITIKNNEGTIAGIDDKVRVEAVEGTSIKIEIPTGSYFEDNESISFVMVNNGREKSYTVGFNNEIKALAVGDTYQTYNAQQQKPLFFGGDPAIYGALEDNFV